MPEQNNEHPETPEASEAGFSGADLAQELQALASKPEESKEAPANNEIVFTRKEIEDPAANSEKVKADTPAAPFVREAYYGHEGAAGDKDKFQEVGRVHERITDALKQYPNDANLLGALASSELLGDCLEGVPADQLANTDLAVEIQQKDTPNAPLVYIARKGESGFFTAIHTVEDGKERSRCILTSSAPGKAVHFITYEYNGDQTQAQVVEDDFSRDPQRIVEFTNVVARYIETQERDVNMVDEATLVWTREQTELSTAQGSHNPNVIRKILADTARWLKSPSSLNEEEHA